jgi:hypothetical protein
LAKEERDDQRGRQEVQGYVEHRSSLSAVSWQRNFLASGVTLTEASSPGETAIASSASRR